MAYTTIDKPSDYFNTTLYTGNGSNNHTISGVGFQSDLTWLKSRSSAISHMWIDAVRGVNTVINSNTNDAETTFNCLDPWNSDGFVLSNNTNFNGNGVTFTSWNWLANGAGSANTDGTISSTVSANTTSGFSIVSYTGTGANATVGHGLGVAPSMVITKRLSSTDDWIVWNKGLTNPASYLYLNSSNAEMGSVAAYQNITPTSTLLYPGTDGRTNGNGDTYISYVFADVQGYSKFGSYTGNGNADGTFVYTGFKPAFVMVKRTDTTNDWKIIDNKRATFNVAGKTLKANSSDAEDGTENYYDFCSNGYKIRNSAGALNASGGSYIYMAFAEAPLVGTNNVPCTAR